MSKKPLITIGPDQHAMLDVNHRVGLEFYRDETEVKYLGFTPHGLEVHTATPAAFGRNFRRRLLAPLGSVAAGLLRQTREHAYNPGDNVLTILTEIYIMATTNGTKDLNTLDGKALTEHYNGLAKAMGREPVKSFKSKGEAIKRIEALAAEAQKLTPKQETNKAKATKEAARKDATAPAKKAADKGARAIKAVAESVAPKGKKPQPAAKKAAKPAKDDAKLRGQGIGAFCKELIKKGKTNEAVLEAAKAKFPDASTSSASVAWYRNKMKADGEIS